MRGQTSTAHVWGRAVLRRFPRLRALARRVLYPEGYETRVREAALAATSRGDCVWDVGANDGLYSRLFVSAVGDTGHVVAIEPLPALSSLLGQLEGVEVVQAALSDRDGEGHMVMQGNEHFRSSFVADEGETAVRLVRGETLARTTRRPDVIKLDVEGSELEALAGLGHVLDSVRTVIVEVHFARLAELGAHPRRVTDVLTQHGLAVRWLDPSHLIGSRV